MATFPVPLELRFAKGLGELVKRVARLEQRTQMLDPGMFVTHYTGQIPGTYTSGDPTVVLTGQTAASGPFKCLTSYTPHANDVVLLIPVGQTYIVAGTFA